MIAQAHKRTQDEMNESDDEEANVDELEETKNKLNSSIKPDGSVDLDGTFPARQRRRNFINRVSCTL